MLLYASVCRHILVLLVGKSKFDWSHQPHKIVHETLRDVNEMLAEGVIPACLVISKLLNSKEELARTTLQLHTPTFQDLLKDRKPEKHEKKRLPGLSCDTLFLSSPCH